MTFAERHLHLTQQLQTCDRLIGGHCFSERTQDELRKTRSEIIEERNILMDAIQLGVVDDGEGI